MKIKRLYAAALCAALVFSFAGCGNDKGSDESGVSSAEESTTSGENTADDSSSDEVSMPVLDIDTELQKEFEKDIDMDKLGPLSKYAVQMMENKFLDVKFDITQVKEDESSKKTESSSSFDMSSIADEITVRIIRNDSKDYRIKLDLGLFSYDLLKTKDGTYSVNTKTRSFSKLDTDKESSSETSGEAGQAIEALKNLTGGMLDDLNTDSMIVEKTEKEVTYNGDGNETYGDTEYKYESYTVKEKLPVNTAAETSEGSEHSKTESKEKKDVTIEMKAYFGDDNMLKLIHLEAEGQKYDITFSKLTTEIDPEDLTIPEEYEEKEASKIDLSEFDISLPDMSSLMN